MSHRVPLTIENFNVPNISFIKGNLANVFIVDHAFILCGSPPDKAEPPPCLGKCHFNTFLIN